MYFHLIKYTGNNLTVHRLFTKLPKGSQYSQPKLEIWCFCLNSRVSRFSPRTRISLKPTDHTIIVTHAFQLGFILGLSAIAKQGISKLSGERTDTWSQIFCTSASAGFSGLSPPGTTSLASCDMLSRNFFSQIPSDNFPTKTDLIEKRDNSRFIFCLLHNWLVAWCMT